MSPRKRARPNPAEASSTSLPAAMTPSQPSSSSTTSQPKPPSLAPSQPSTTSQTSNISSQATFQGPSSSNTPSSAKAEFQQLAGGEVPSTPQKGLKQVRLDLALYHTSRQLTSRSAGPQSSQLVWLVVTEVPGVYTGGQGDHIGWDYEAQLDTRLQPLRHQEEH